MISIVNNGGSYVKGWINYCEGNEINYKLVQPYTKDFFSYLISSDIILWHYSHVSFKDQLVAKDILFALEHSGRKVFPNFKTAWHFDNKIAQTYLLQSLNLPSINTYIFYDKHKALMWANETSYPKVFKLSKGAGSSNVILINSIKSAEDIINRAFKNGISQFNRFNYLYDRYNEFKCASKGKLKILIRGIARSIIKTNYARETYPEKGYVYFQDYIDKNDSDIRIVVVGKRAVALKRIVRDNDFRASGSGKYEVDASIFKLSTIKLAFLISQKLQAQCCAMDFIYDENNQEKIIEVSYGISVDSYKQCPGFWDDKLNFHEDDIDIEGWIIENI